MSSRPEAAGPAAPEQKAQSSHMFTVTVTGCTEAQAEQVMAERLCHDEDYGFDYEVGYEKTRENGA